MRKLKNIGYNERFNIIVDVFENDEIDELLEVLKEFKPTVKIINKNNNQTRFIIQTSLQTSSFVWTIIEKTNTNKII